MRFAVLPPNSPGKGETEERFKGRMAANGNVAAIEAYNELRKNGVSHEDVTDCALVRTGSALSAVTLECPKCRALSSWARSSAEPRCSCGMLLDVVVDEAVRS